MSEEKYSASVSRIMEVYLNSLILCPNASTTAIIKRLEDLFVIVDFGKASKNDELVERAKGYMTQISEFYGEIDFSTAPQREGGSELEEIYREILAQGSIRKEAVVKRYQDLVRGNRGLTILVNEGILETDHTGKILYSSLKKLETSMEGQEYVTLRELATKAGINISQMNTVRRKGLVAEYTEAIGTNGRFTLRRMASDKIEEFVGELKVGESRIRVGGKPVTIPENSIPQEIPRTPVPKKSPEIDAYEIKKVYFRKEKERLNRIMSRNERDTASVERAFREDLERILAESGKRELLESIDVASKLDEVLFQFLPHPDKEGENSNEYNKRREETRKRVARELEKYYRLLISKIIHKERI